MQEELKMHQQELKMNLNIEKSNMDKYRKLMNDNKNEILNQEGIANNAKLLVEIYSLKYMDPNPGALKQFKNITVRLILDENVLSTSARNATNLNFSDHFEFPITTKETNLIFEVCNNDKALGQSKVPLNKIINQDEYEIELEISDENNDRSIWNVGAKITLIWSYYKLYQDNFNKSETNYNNYYNKFEKSTVILENLTDPFKFLQQVDNRVSKEHQDLSVITDSGNYLHIQFKVADQVEDFIKTTLSIIY